MSKSQLNLYISFLDFIALVLGECFEVVLHDLSRPNNTIIAIRNGHITNRKIGDTLSDMTLSIISKLPKEVNDLRKYRSKALFISGIDSEDFIIRDLNGQPIGLFCINYNAKMLKDSRKLINSLFNQNMPIVTDSTEQIVDAIDTETFMTTAEILIDKVISEYTIDASRMVAEEKLEVVKTLYNKGIFQLKDIIGTVALKLHVSEATIYRYISNI